MLRDLTPERRKSRYGDIDFDFEHGVDTTWATVSLRTRVREWLSGGQYQPSEPALFREIIGVASDNAGRLHVHRSRLGKRPHAADGVELSLPANYRNGAAGRAERDCGCRISRAIRATSSAASRSSRTPETRATSSFLPSPPCCTCSIRFPGTSGERYWRICTNPCGPRRARFIVIYHNPVHEDILNAQSWLREIETDASVRDL